MTLSIAIPGRSELRLEHLLLDVNGTLTNRGLLVDGVSERLGRLRHALQIHLVSADTFGTLEAIAERLHVAAIRALSSVDKLRVLDELGGHGCVVIGNGANDALVLQAAVVSFAVLGAEGASASALRSADVVCISATDALDLLLDPQVLSATLRP